MKLALNIEWVGARRGGAEKYAGIVARSLHEAGHEVHVFARGVDAGELPPGVAFRLVESRKIPCLGFLRAFRFAAASQQALERERFDLIVGFNKTWCQDIYLAVAGPQQAAVEHSLARFQSPWRRRVHAWGKLFSLKQWVFKLIERKQFASRTRAPHVIAPSRLTARHFHEVHDLPQQNMSVVYNGITRDRATLDAAHKREEFRREMRLSEDDVALLFTARNYELKGLEPLLQAFQKVAQDRPRARLMVCGCRRDAAFRRRAAQLGLTRQVRFLGFVDDVARTFLGCDAFVMPTFYDPCSLVVPEAMQWGLPVITTECNGAAELIRPGHDGFVVATPWHTDELAEAMARLIDDGGLRRKMSANARRSAENFTMETRLAELLAVLERRCERAAPTEPRPAANATRAA